MEARKDPRAGEFYKHFKDKLYQVVTVAKHSETGEKLVIYQALYGEFGIYARPIEMFMSEVDHEKYPAVTQKYRFELVDMGKESEEEVKERDGEKVARRPKIFKPEVQEAVEEVTKELQEGADEQRKKIETKKAEEKNYLVKFLDAQSLGDKKAILLHNKNSFTQKDLDCIYTTLDIEKMAGNEPQQVAGIVRYLDMQEHYEGGRLRNK